MTETLSLLDAEERTRSPLDVLAPLQHDYAKVSVGLAAVKAAEYVPADDQGEDPLVRKAFASWLRLAERLGDAAQAAECRRTARAWLAADRAADACTAQARGHLAEAAEALTARDHYYAELHEKKAATVVETVAA